MQYIKKFTLFNKLFAAFFLLVITQVSPLLAGGFVVERTLKWQTAQPHSVLDKKFGSWQTFSGAIHREDKNYLPVYQEVFPLQQDQVENILIKPLKTEILTKAGVQSAEFLTGDFQLHYQIAWQNKKPYVIVELVPLSLNNGEVEQLLSFSIEINTRMGLSPPVTLNKKTYAANSVLAKGDWFRIATLNNGVHRIDYAGLRNMGINPDAIDPRQIQLYGRGAGMVPQQNDQPRIDDLAQLSILVQGEEDGKFNPGDFIAFYGESQLNQWRFNPSTLDFSHVSNLYCDTTYYFLTVGTQNGKRIPKVDSEQNPGATVNNYQYLYFYETEKLNLIKSGKVWVGEEFDKVTKQSFNVSIPNLVATLPITFRSSVTAHSFVPSEFKINLGGTTLLRHDLGAVDPGYESRYTGGLDIRDTFFISNSANFTLDYIYNKPSGGSIGWLDYFELKAKAELVNYSGNFIFREPANLGPGNKTLFNIRSNRPLTVLDVTNPVSPFSINGSYSNNVFSFTTATDSLKTFCAYDGSNYLQVVYLGKIANQNLHAMPYADGLIITHPAFYAEAERLAEHHRKLDKLTITVVNIQEIYNEFGAGTPDMCAVRDFLRMFYKRTTDPMPKYVLLMGRASYDYKYRHNPNSNYIPTFESNESFGPTTSYCSDDFLGYLDDNEGQWDTGKDSPSYGELLDIGIGRLPASSNEEATNMVNKCIAYASVDALANWRNNMVFAADDGDSNGHQIQAEQYANNILAKYPEFNVEKILLDAYKRQSTAGGSRFPDAQTAMNNAIEKGCLVFNYNGHGGEVGLTAERVMGIDDINNWTNGLPSTGSIRLPLFMTATCEFSRFDDPSRTAAGEMVLLSPKGGGIALFTTVRLVYSGENGILNERFYENIGFDSINPAKLGDIIRRTKNAFANSSNTRNFTLLGDPFVTLAHPNYKVKTTMINGVDATLFTDTLKALKKMEFKGVVTTKAGAVATNFNGVIYPTVYDKMSTYITLGQTDGSGPMPFAMQNNVLYRGKASVVNGNFSFSFIVPKDIAYEYGKGKISYYGENHETDANGYTNTIVIGGTNDSAMTDNKGPELKLFFNDEKFVNGGITNENPTFIAKLFDESGINTTGRGIGRDLTGTLNNNNTQSVVMNDYYQATINSYQSGEVTYQYKDLPVGRHHLKFKAYDVYNNLSEATIDFEVKKAENPQVSHLLNYPNPFNNHTTFHFDHNLPSENLSVMIQVFTVSGRLVKTLQADIFASGNHFDQLTWDGRDDYGDRLAKGVYVYKLKLKPATGKTVEKIEKLVILN